MAKIIDDYSDYQSTAYERYQAFRRDKKTLKLNYFSNKVLYDRDEHSLSINTDIYFEYFSVHDMLEKESEEIAKRTGRPVLQPYVGLDEETEGYRQEDIADNEKWWKLLSEKYEIYPAEGMGMYEMFFEEHREIPVQPLINLFSGKVVNIRLGGGILDYVYADFETPYEERMRGLAAMRYLQIIDEQDRKRRGISENTREINKILNKEQLLLEDYHAFYDTFKSIHEIAYASLYSAICPPIFYHSETLDFREADRYGNYLIELQKEYRELLEFCYDEDFYPELLSKLRPSERFALYRQVHSYPTWTERTELFELNHWFMSGETMPYGMEKEKEQERFTEAIRRDTADFTEFAERYGVSPGYVQVCLARANYVTVAYRVNSVADMLQLEFTKMLEENIRFRKCKRCGRYFIMKGNYNTNFCDRVDPETGKTCKELGAIDNFKKKMADNAAIPLYQKYYKRYAARVKVKQIKEKDFKKWKYEAVSKRDDCCEGKISVEEYEAWLEQSFPNRKKS